MIGNLLLAEWLMKRPHTGDSEIMKIIECPRDAMQGITDFIPTDTKAAYINQLLKVGFDVIDFGSFVSPKAVPQMRDTALVLDRLEPSERTKLLAIVANMRGAQEASSHEQIAYIGFPLSVSETFQLRNTNQSIPKALSTTEQIQDICLRFQKELVVYISMGFGNPYGDPYDEDVVLAFIEKLQQMAIRTVALSDTIGVATAHQISSLFKNVAAAFPTMEVGVHLHSRLERATEKIAAAYRAGCRRFDGALMGFGGCPMAEDKLVGNIPTELIVDYVEGEDDFTKIDKAALKRSLEMATAIFLKS